MKHATLTINGKTRKTYAWLINPREVCAALKAKRIQTARDLSWQLLNDDQSIQAMEDQQDGDSAARNFALSVFENCLDWTLGMAVLAFIRAAVRAGKMPKPFYAHATRKGDVYIQTSAGRILNHRLELCA